MSAKTTRQHKRTDLLKLSKLKLIKLCKKEKISVTGTKNQMVNALLKKSTKAKVGKNLMKFDWGIIRIYIHKKVKMNGAIETKNQKMIRSSKYNKNLLLSLGIRYKKFPIALCSNKLINNNISSKLINLIKPLQNKLYNYRNPQFIKTHGYYNDIERLIKYDINGDYDSDYCDSIKSDDEERWIKNNKKLLQNDNLRRFVQNSDGDGDGDDDYDSDDPDDVVPDVQKVQVDMSDMILIDNTKPKVKDLIAKFQHFYENKRILRTMNKKQYSTVKRAMPIAPAIYDLSKESFITEINGLLYSRNIELYDVIGNIFKLFLPMFEWCIQTRINKFKQLSLIIKMHEYIFENAYNVCGIWHNEGIKQDNIVAVGLYYFNDNNNDQKEKEKENGLRFNQNILEIAAEHCHKKRSFLTEKIQILPNDCIVFSNSNDIKHRVSISAVSQNTQNIKYLSRKTLCFFLLDPNNNFVSSYNSNDFKWINFPLKVDKIVYYYLKYKNINRISNDIIILITNFTFGDNKYQQTEMSNIRSDRRPNQFFTNYRRPFHIEKLKKRSRPRGYYHGADD